MDGTECCAGSASGRACRACAVRARGEDDKIGALDAGADDYLTKPFTGASCWPACAQSSGAHPEPVIRRL